MGSPSCIMKELTLNETPDIEKKIEHILSESLFDGDQVEVYS